jgi:hypothetical protein
MLSSYGSRLYGVFACFWVLYGGAGAIQSPAMSPAFCLSGTKCKCIVMFRILQSGLHIFFTAGNRGFMLTHAGWHVPFAIQNTPVYQDTGAHYYLRGRLYNVGTGTVLYSKIQ